MDYRSKKMHGTLTVPNADTNAEWPCWQDAKWSSHFGKQLGGFLKNYTQSHSKDSTIALFGIYPKDENVCFQQKPGTRIFIAVLFTTAKTCKKPGCPSVGEQINYDTLKGVLLLLSCQVMPDSFVTPWTGSPPGSSVCGISQARILEWAAISFSRGSLRPRDRMQIFCLAGGFLTTGPLGKPCEKTWNLKCTLLSEESIWREYKTAWFQP